MAANIGNYDQNIRNGIYDALNGKASPFAKAAFEEQKTAIDELVAQEEARRNDPKYTPMTTAQIKNAANERAAARAEEKISHDLHTAKVAGDDTTSMTGFMLGMAFGEGGGSILDMAMKVYKGESPFWKTVKETFTGEKIELANFTDRWKANVEDKVLTDYAKDNKVSKNELVAALSRTDGTEVKLVKIQELDPAQEVAQKEKMFTTKVEEVKANARLRAQLQYEEEKAAREEKERLKNLEAKGQSSIVTENGKGSEVESEKKGENTGKPNFSGGEHIEQTSFNPPASLPRAKTVTTQQI
ncbi:MAG: hypothetical protein AABY33_07255 [Pseudomonadota bacterium]